MGHQDPDAEAQPALLATEAGSTAAETAAQVAGTAAEAGDSVMRTAAQIAGGQPRDASTVPQLSDSSNASGTASVHAPVAARDWAEMQPAEEGTKQAAPAPGSQQAPASPSSPGQCVPAPRQLMRGLQGKLPAPCERVTALLSSGQ